jgi:hypothetical protein
MGVVGGGNAGADVEELADAGLAGQIPHRPGQERAVPTHALYHVRVFPHGGLGSCPVGGEVVLSAEPVVIDAGDMRDAGIDLRQMASLFREGSREPTAAR